MNPALRIASPFALHLAAAKSRPAPNHEHYELLDASNVRIGNVYYKAVHPNVQTNNGGGVRIQYPDGTRRFISNGWYE